MFGTTNPSTEEGVYEWAAFSQKKKEFMHGMLSLKRYVYLRFKKMLTWSCTLQSNYWVFTIGVMIETLLDPSSIPHLVMA